MQASLRFLVKKYLTTFFWYINTLIKQFIEFQNIWVQKKVDLEKMFQKNVSPKKFGLKYFGIKQLGQKEGGSNNFFSPTFFEYNKKIGFTK